ADRVHFVGSVYGPDKLASFVDCEVFCLPSRQEGFSMAITEALACRKPVVISDQCHFPEVAETRCGYVTPVGAEPTAAALDAALSLPAAEAAAMGERGYELVTSRFTWPKIAERTIEAYRSHASR
ncbi:MAG: glycosyltransferase, partial [Planctomycetota bacterium]